MDTRSFAPDSPAVVTGKPSRLPAGSTLEVGPGIHVPHPHAEVNLPGAPDNRLGITDAVTETLAGHQTPLAEEVKPHSLTVAKGAVPVRETTIAPAVTATSAETKLAADTVHSTDTEAN